MGFDKYVSEEILLNRELQGVVDRHKCCHGSQLLAVGVRKWYSKFYESSRFKLNEKIDDQSKSQKYTFGSLFWQSIYTKELFLHLLAWKRDTYA